MLTRETWDNSGKSYTSDEEKEIVLGFLMGKGLQSLCKLFQRPPSGIIEKLRKQGLVVKDAVNPGWRGLYNVVITSRGKAMRRDYAVTASQRDALAEQAAKLTAKEDEAMLTTGEGNMLVYKPETAFLEDGKEAIMPIVRDGDTTVLRYPNGNVAVVFGVIPEPQAESLETSTFISCENIMNASINISVNVTLNGKAVTSYSDNDLLDLLTQQESKIKLLAEITAEKSARRDELLDAAKQQRDDLLKLLDSRAKGGDSLLSVATYIANRKAVKFDFEAQAAEVKVAE